MWLRKVLVVLLIGFGLGFYSSQVCAQNNVDFAAVVVDDDGSDLNVQPTVLAAAGPATDVHYSLGIRGEIMAGGGLRVTSAAEQSRSPLPLAAGTDLPLEVGDVILAIDDRPINAASDYHQALAGCRLRGGIIRVRFRAFRIQRIQIRNFQLRRIVRTNNRQNPNQTRNQNQTQQTAGGRVKVLLISDVSDPNVAPALDSGRRQFRDMMMGVPGIRTQDIYELRGALTPAAVLSKVSQIPVASQDTFVVFFGSHGAYKPEWAAGDPSGGHFFAIGGQATVPGQPLKRRGLWNSLKARNARLTVLISESCNVDMDKFARSGAKALPGQFASAAGNGKLLKNLFLDHAGQLDVNSSGKDQFTWGGLFPTHFSRLASENPSSFVGWNSFLSRLSQNTSQEFNRMKPSMLQDPRVPEINKRFLRYQRDMRPAVFVNNLRVGR